MFVSIVNKLIQSVCDEKQLQLFINTSYVTELSNTETLLLILSVPVPRVKCSSFNAF